LATIGKLAGGIAHEFNNPLDGVMRYTNLCLEHIRDDDVVRGYLLEIKYGLNRMANIVRNLLACSRNEFPNRKKVDVSQALDYSISSVHTEISKKKIFVEKEIAGNIPAIEDLKLLTHIKDNHILIKSLNFMLNNHAFEGSGFELMVTSAVRNQLPNTPST